MLPRSSGTVEIPGKGTLSFQDLISSGQARPSAELRRRARVRAAANAKAKMELEGTGLVFEVSAVNAGKSPPVGVFSSFEPAAYMFIGLSFLLHIGIVASMAFFMPKMGADDAEAIDRDQLLLNAEDAERGGRARAGRAEDGAAAGSERRPEGRWHRPAREGEEGSMGNPNTKDTNKRYGVQGPQDNADPHIARQAAMKEAAESA